MAKLKPIEPTPQLVQGGIMAIGGHQLLQAEEKLKRQREYKAVLEQQQQSSAKHPADQRRDQISQQVFNEVLSG